MYFLLGILIIAHCCEEFIWRFYSWRAGFFNARPVSIKEEFLNSFALMLALLVLVLLSRFSSIFWHDILLGAVLGFIIADGFGSHLLASLATLFSANNKRGYSPGMITGMAYIFFSLCGVGAMPALVKAVSWTVWPLVAAILAALGLALNWLIEARKQKTA